jgi:serine/threonine-protein kinase
VADLVDRALAFDRADRWPTAAAMRDAADAAHRSIFGTSPTPGGLAGLVSIPSERTYRQPDMPGLSPPARTIVTETPSPKAVSSASAMTSTPLHTIAPVSSSRRHAADGRSRPFALVVGISGTAVALGVIGWLALRSHAGSNPTAAASPGVVVSPSGDPAQATAAAPPTGAPVAPPPEPQAQPAATAAHAAPTPAVPEPRTRPVVVPPPRTTPTPAKPPAADQFDRQ